MATLRLLLGIGLILAVACMAYKLVPPFFANYEFEDALRNDAVQATYSTRSIEDVRNTIIKQAQDYNITLTPQQVHVTRVGGFGTGTFDIDAEYSVPVELPGYTATLDFHPSTHNTGTY